MRIVTQEEVPFVKHRDIPETVTGIPESFEGIKREQHGIARTACLEVHSPHQVVTHVSIFLVCVSRVEMFWSGISKTSQECGNFFRQKVHLLKALHFNCVLSHLQAKIISSSLVTPLVQLCTFFHDHEISQKSRTKKFSKFYFERYDTKSDVRANAIVHPRSY